MAKKDKLIDKDPQVRVGQGTKESRTISPSLVMRRREPTNPMIASKFPQMIFDHKKQLPVWPDNRATALIESTQGYNGGGNMRCINASGKPFALNVEVGGSPDDPGRPFLKPKALKTIKG